MQIGTIREIWRHPVKSLGGERVDAAHFEARGVADDRCWAVCDELTGEIVGGKKIPRLMMLRARYSGEPVDAFGQEIRSGVEIELPDGRLLRSDDPYASAILSMHLGRRVRLIRRPLPSDKAAYRLAKPMTPAEVRYALGMKADDPDPDFSSFSLGLLATLARYATPPGTLYDVYPLHFLTTAALNTMSRHYPQGDFSPRRYRPNFVIETDPALEGIVENEWRGHELRIGDALIHCNHPTIRCSMPGAAQPGLARDPNIPLAVMQHAGQHLGAYATPRHRAQIRVGDTVELLPGSNGRVSVWMDRMGRRTKAKVLALYNRLGEQPERRRQQARKSRPADARRPPGFLPHTLLRREQESKDVCSFWLARSDQSRLPRFVPGQHIILAIPQADGSPVFRPYSLSSGSHERGRYRISVKREDVASEGGVEPGRGSGYLHEHLHVGDTIAVKAPAGQFAVIPGDETPLVLISAGIGITPFLSILRTLTQEHPQRVVYLLHGIRSLDNFPFQAELEELLEGLPNLQLRVYLGQAGGAVARPYLQAGRLNLGAALTQVDCASDAQFMLCGKPAFSRAMHEELLVQGVAPGRIHAESFGASQILGPRDENHYTIAFSESGQDLRWDGQQESLLSLAENNGIEARSGCRYGACQACEATLLSGEVSYPEGVQPPAGKNRILLCSARPCSDLELAL